MNHVTVSSYESWTYNPLSIKNSHNSQVASDWLLSSWYDPKSAASFPGWVATCKKESRELNRNDYIGVVYVLLTLGESKSKKNGSLKNARKLTRDPKPFFQPLKASMSICVGSDFEIR